MINAFLRVADLLADIAVALGELGGESRERAPELVQLNVNADLRSLMEQRATGAAAAMAKNGTGEKPAHG
jgi:hypothetical protein